MSEMDEYKALVRRKAKEYADEHELCSVVDDFLRDVDIEPVCTPTTIPLTVTLVCTQQVEMGTLELEGLDEEGKLALLRDDLYISGNLYLYSRNGKVDIPENYINPDAAPVTIALGTPEPTDGLPSGYRRVFMSSEGRVRHIIAGQLRSNYGQSLCGQYGYSTRISSRSEDRNCARCDTILTKRI